jgi:hypothetical protein
MKNENKINTDVYNNVRLTILNDYRKLTELKPILDGLSDDDKRALIELVIELSGFNDKNLPPLDIKGQIRLDGIPEWLAIIEQWEIISALGDDQKTANELGNIAYEMYHKLDGLRNLKEKEILFIDFILTLTEGFKDRIKIKPIDNKYDESIHLSPPMQSLEGLRTAVHLLERAAAQDQINPQVYNKTIQRLKKDLKVLEDDTTSKDEIRRHWGTKPEEIERLKVKALELIDRIEQNKQMRLEDQPEWKAIIEQWDVVSQLGWWQKTSKELDAIRIETDERLYNLYKLVNKGLVSVALVEIMEQDFKQMQQVAPVNVDCYRQYAVSPKKKGWEHLQSRLPLLEKAIEEGKINPVAYQKVIIKLKQDLAVLDDTSNENDMSFWEECKKSYGLKPEDIEAIKKKARELIEKVEPQENPAKDGVGTDKQ